MKERRKKTHFPLGEADQNHLEDFFKLLSQDFAVSPKGGYASFSSFPTWNKLALWTRYWWEYTIFLKLRTTGQIIQVCDFGTEKPVEGFLNNLKIGSIHWQDLILLPYNKSFPSQKNISLSQIKTILTKEDSEDHFWL